MESLQCDHVKERILVCLHSHDQIEDFRKQLNALDESIKYYTDTESCLTFLESTSGKSVFFIVSNCFLSEIISRLDIFQPIDFIFVFYVNKTECKHIYHEFDVLCSSIYE